MTFNAVLCLGQAYRACRKAWMIGAVAMSVVAGSAGAGPGEEIVQALNAGVAGLSLTTAVPGPLVVYGDRSVVVRTGHQGGTRAPIVAAAPYGGGRVVVYGHGAFISQLSDPDNVRLLANAVRWTSGRAAARIALVDPFGQRAAAAEALAKEGGVVTRLPDAELLQALRQKAFDTFVIDASVFDGQPERVKAALEFVHQGGGMVIDSLGWGWLMLHPGQSLKRDHGGNQFTRPMGIAWADGVVEPTGPDGFAADSAEAMSRSHAGLALLALERHAAGSSPLDSATAVQALDRVTGAVVEIGDADPTFLQRVRKLAASANETLPREAAPVTQQQVAARLRMRLDALDLAATPAQEVRAHPAAAFFPGAVPAATPLVKRKLVIDTAVPGWHGTGLYAAPGAAITVQWVATKPGIGVRIGGHSDTLWHSPAWQRAPEISVSQVAAQPTLSLSNPFGGAIYVDVPAEAAQGRIDVTISGAVEAPRFIRGVTSQREWNESRQRAAPWAELEGRSVILSLPSSIARGVDDPEGLMAYWDQMVDNTAELFGQKGLKRRPERLMFDMQISVGLMHAGYPIMVQGYEAVPWLRMAQMATQLRDKQPPAGDNSWGYFHEVGHNFQRDWWTFDGTREVTNNLAVLYNIERLNGQPVGRGHVDLEPTQRQQAWSAYVAAGRPFAAWKERPFLALQMYLQLREAFGWEAYKAVFAGYESDARLRPSALPVSEEQKRDQWMVRFSQAVGRNLAPFFAAWGVPVSDAARAAVAGLPAWMPPDMK